MKVLKKGSRTNSSIKVTCTGAGNADKGCGAKLLVEPEDVYITKSSDYGGGTDVYKTVMCIECGAETDIKGSIEARGTKPPDATRDRIRKAWRERSHE